MRQKRFYVFLTFILVNLSACKVFYPNYLFRDTKDYYYYELKEVEEQKQTILPEDEISFSVYTRDGYNLIDVVGGGASGGGSARFLVKTDGYVELPLLGELYVEGLTRLELEKLLEKKYSVWYNDPFIQLNVTNRRVYIFEGVGSASVLGLPSENTKLLEVLALRGGLSGNSKANKIKIIRGDYENPSIKKVDLSTIAGLKDADFIVQPNDLIFIETRLRPSEVIVRELNWLMTLVTTITTVYLLGLSIARN